MLASFDYDQARPAYSPLLADWVLHQHGGELAGRALDVGCGTGRSTRWARAFANQIVGIDRSPEMLAVARQVNDDPAVSFAAGSAEDFGEVQGPVDLVVSASAFEWFDKPRFAREVIRVADAPCRIVIAWSWLEPKDDVTHRWFWLLRSLVGAQVGPDVNDAQTMAWTFFPERPRVKTIRTLHRYDESSLAAFVRSSSYWADNRPQKDAAMRARIEKFVDQNGDADGRVDLFFREVAFLGGLS
ncbi:SAM-dependent methyltransferase [Actinoplanes campanulatus]|uniref:SAM-dependent methyltransferase n=1 Tax=Actinoplanes campanulatus TaxID=113559 RepID=A0A7W5ASP8_9ACTN|nr:class I SAM-dependent methyltransferase [Actinoplanes campanulatus]MBB3101600.1 SAM-dependent methyltransferase [Actinoplanes campanulatus]GGN48732.1 hypothetical protein GCM10010109_86100 [Actinoplanes campanulatus]GID41675.1 hypothetical protein Aca09nite_81810 [Actinoplanes campanulatus]